MADASIVSLAVAVVAAVGSRAVTAFANRAKRRTVDLQRYLRTEAPDQLGDGSAEVLSHRLSEDDTRRADRLIARIQQLEETDQPEGVRRVTEEIVARYAEAVSNEHVDPDSPFRSAWLETIATGPLAPDFIALTSSLEHDGAPHHVIAQVDDLVLEEKLTLHARQPTYLSLPTREAGPGLVRIEIDPPAMVKLTRTKAGGTTSAERTAWRVSEPR